MQFTISLKTNFFGCFDLLKKEQISNFNEISLKKWIFFFNFESLVSPSFDDLHCSTIVRENHMEPMFQNLSLYWTKKVPKNHNQLFSLLSWVWNSTHGACSDLDMW